MHPDLIARLVECHRPRRGRDYHAYDEQHLVQCPACDGNRWTIWRRGDPEYACDLWREAQASQGAAMVSGCAAYHQSGVCDCVQFGPALTRS